MTNSESTSRTATVETVRAVLAADCACSEVAFLKDGLVVTVAEDRAGRRRFPRPRKPLLMVTMGRGAVVTCHPDRVEWLASLLAQRSRDEIFAASTIAALTQAIVRDGQQLHGPTAKLVCSRETLRPALPPTAVTITLLEGAAVFDLYRYAGFPHALAYRVDHPRPDVVAAVARHGGNVVGIAAASADCDRLWQIGVDVVPAARGAGIGRALVSGLTEAVFHHERIPYYSAALSNVPSLALATSIGYWPLWCELYVRDEAPDPA
jgi:GNAT superfamily N-acetyltransferase